MQEEIGKPKNLDYPVVTIEERDSERVVSRIGSRVSELVAQPMSKQERGMAADSLENEILGSFAGDETIEVGDIKTVFRKVLKEETRRLVLEMQHKNHAAIQLAKKLGFDFCGYNDRYYANHDIGLFFAKSLR